MLPCNPLVNPSHLCNRFPYKGTNTGGGVELPLPEQRGSAHSPEDRAGGDEIPAGRGEAALRNFKTYKELYKVVAAWSYPAFINEGPNND